MISFLDDENDTNDIMNNLVKITSNEDKKTETMVLPDLLEESKPKLSTDLSNGGGTPEFKQFINSMVNNDNPHPHKAPLAPSEGDKKSLLNCSGGTERSEMSAGHCDTEVHVHDTDEMLENTNNILLMPISNLDELELLRRQHCVAIYLKRTIKGTNSMKEEEVKDVIEKLHWLYDVSEILLTKRKQENCSKSSKMDVGAIMRSSYKFCRERNDCQNYYNVEKKKGCKMDHYAYNKVKTDIASLLSYLIFSVTKQPINHMEVERSISTISFVITHMYTELSIVNKQNNYPINRRTDFTRRDGTTMSKTSSASEVHSKGRNEPTSNDGWQTVAPNLT
jgi:hypothetical protein